jgi:hypothetical protein
LLGGVLEIEPIIVHADLDNIAGLEFALQNLGG